MNQNIPCDLGRIKRCNATRSADLFFVNTKDCLDLIHRLIKNRQPSPPVAQQVERLAGGKAGRVPFEADSFKSEASIEINGQIGEPSCDHVNVPQEKGVLENEPIEHLPESVQESVVFDRVLDDKPRDKPLLTTGQSASNAANQLSGAGSNPGLKNQTYVMMREKAKQQRKCFLLGRDRYSTRCAKLY